MTFSSVPGSTSLYVSAPRTKPVNGQPACPERPQGRWTFRRGLAVGAFGSLTVAGLIVSSTMAGLDGKTWGFNQIGTPVPYQLQTATQAGFGATVGMGVGLALSLLIP